MYTLCSLFRLPNEAEATRLLNNYSYKLQALIGCARSKLMNRDRLQELCDTLRENPGWSCAHLAAKFSLVECFRNDFVAAYVEHMFVCLQVHRFLH